MRATADGVSKKGSAVALAILLIPCLGGVAHADPLRLRGDAFAQSPSPTGLLVLQGEDAKRPWVSAEGLAWVGAGNRFGPGSDTTTGDVLALTVKLRDPGGRGEVRFGRFMVSTGSVRPLHLDGASALGRSPWGTSLEAFGGVPVVPRFSERMYDWAIGGRLAQNMSDKAVLGVAYVQKRDRGELSDEEVGADLSVVPARFFDLAARGAYDLATEGLADAIVSAGSRVGHFRFEAFGQRRSPSRLLPATSLFSVLGDVPTTRAGGTIKWFAAPRLDVFASGAGQVQEDHDGYEALLRTTLRTDDDGEGNLGLELRRQGMPGTSWSGVRGIASVPIVTRLRASTELELVAPDEPNGRGTVWPWGLVALGVRPTDNWDVAAAMEAAARPNVAREVTALVRASYSWGRR